MSEWVHPFPSQQSTDLIASSNESIRLALSRSSPALLAAANALNQRTFMSERGPAVLLHPAHDLSGKEEKAAVATFEDKDDLEERKRQEEPRSPIAQMLYTRWLMSLREQCENWPVSQSDETADFAFVGAVGI